jgi:glycosyltransferase involved in cell wall biosynthesis
MKKIVVTIPAYNEQKTIGNVISDIKAALLDNNKDHDKYNLKIIVINDGSTDDTAKVAMENGAQVISFAGNRGLVEVFKRGMNEAIRLDPDVIVNIDGDGQHDPSEIKNLIKPILMNKADLAIGSRFLGKIDQKSRTKYFGNVVFSRLISLLIKHKVTDAQSGYRAYTPELARRLTIHRGYTYTQQMIVQAKYHGFKILDVPITEKIRKSGKSKLIKNPFSFAYRAGTLLVTVIASYYPLAFFGAIGFILMILGSIIGLLPEPRRVLAAVIIIVGFFSLMFGLLLKVMNNLMER